MLTSDTAANALRCHKIFSGALEARVDERFPAQKHPHTKLGKCVCHIAELIAKSWAKKGGKNRQKLLKGIPVENDAFDGEDSDSGVSVVDIFFQEKIYLITFQSLCLADEGEDGEDDFNSAPAPVLAIFKAIQSTMKKCHKIATKFNKSTLMKEALYTAQRAADITHLAVVQVIFV
jgi:hypothetical protein